MFGTTSNKNVALFYQPVFCSRLLKLGIYTHFYFFSDDKPEIQGSKINLEPLGSTDTQRRQKSVTGHHFSTDCRLLVILPAQEALIGTKTSRVVPKLQVDC